MAEKDNSNFVENDDDNIPDSQPSSSELNGDSGSSFDSSGIGTLTLSVFPMSRSVSEVSIRTGSEAYNRLPPRPVPPPPLPRLQRLLSSNTTRSFPSSGEPPRPISPPTLKIPIPLLKKKSFGTRTLSLKDNCSTTDSSSDISFEQNQFFFPGEEEILKTFSSQSLRHVLYALPPAYPPPPPPDSPPLSPISSRPSTHLQESTPPTTPLLLLPPRRPGGLETPPPNHYPDVSNVYDQYEMSESAQSTCCPLLKSWTLLSLTFMSLTLSSVCCTFVAFSGIFYNNYQTPSRVCVNLRNDNGAIPGFLQNLVVNTYGEYCAVTGDDLSQLLQAMLSVQTNIGARGSQPRHVSAHKYFQAPNFTRSNCDSTVGMNQHLKLVTSESKDLSQNYVNVEVESDGLRMLHSGWYFVYSSINFSPYPCFSGQQVVMTQTIIRAMLDGSQTNAVLSRSNHICHYNCNKDSHTSYTGGIFQLSKNDLIFVNVSGSKMVDFDQFSSFMGLVMVGEASEN